MARAVTSKTRGDARGVRKDVSHDFQFKAAMPKV